MKSRVVLDERRKIWTAEIALPMRSLAPAFDPKKDWRVNFFRVEGPTEPRYYSSWRLTRTPQPNFHVPEAFGRLCFH
jgi:alpha-galactosidase